MCIRDRWGSKGGRVVRDATTMLTLLQSPTANEKHTCHKIRAGATTHLDIPILLPHRHNSSAAIWPDFTLRTTEHAGLVNPDTSAPSPSACAPPHTRLSRTKRTVSTSRLTQPSHIHHSSALYTTLFREHYHCDTACSLRLAGANRILLLHLSLIHI